MNVFLFLFLICAFIVATICWFYFDPSSNTVRLLGRGRLLSPSTMSLS